MSRLLNQIHLNVVVLQLQRYKTKLQLLILIFANHFHIITHPQLFEKQTNKLVKIQSIAFEFAVLKISK